MFDAEGVGNEREDQMRVEQMSGLSMAVPLSSRSRRVWTLPGVALGISIACAGQAFAIDQAVFKRVIAGLAECEKTLTGPQINTCVANRIDGVGAKLPDSATILPQTVAEVRAAPNKAAAVSVLNRARSVVQGLAAKSSGFAKEGYGLMNQIYARSIDVINRKG
jgi:hypothetical protein